MKNIFSVVFTAYAEESSPNEIIQHLMRDIGMKAEGLALVSNELPTSSMVTSSLISAGGYPMVDNQGLALNKRRD